MEQPPKVSKDEMVKALVNMSSLSEQMTILVQTVNDNYEYSKEMYTIKDFQVRFLVTPTTIKSDLEHLLDIGIVKQIALNKVKKGYIKGDSFDDTIRSFNP